MARYRVAVDTGGTFNDFVVFNEDTGELRVLKVPSTPRDPSQAVMQGVARLMQDGIRPEEVTFFSHGTTVATNALLENKTALAGALVTRGFTGLNTVLQTPAFGPAIYQVFADLPKYLIPPRYTAEIEERVDFQGKVLQPLDEAQVRETVRKLVEKGVQSLAVCLLFSFMEPDHEQAVRRIIQQEYPGFPVSLSSEVLPRIREFPRFSTTLVNAQVNPVLTRYLGRLESELRERGIAARQTYVMQSNGGVATFRLGADLAVNTILSGPAAGVVATSQLALQAGFPNAIGFDMGGTSCDIALIEDGHAIQTNHGSIGRWEIAIPMLDINTISAGGGTIARVTEVGTLQVGPDSSGADPGPACYGRGGTVPAITDANVVLGFINPDYFVGGGMSLDRSLAEKAVMEKVARPLGLSLLEAAEGIVRIINVQMAQAVKAVSAERGYDLREFVLVAFGGAGPVHAARVAADLGIPRVMVPLAPGATSALGLLLSDVRRDYMLSRLGLLTGTPAGDINQRFNELGERAIAELEGEGFSRGQIVLSHLLDLRYSGQGYELTVPCPRFPLQDADLPRLRTGFDEAHERLFGHRAEAQPVELVSYRLVATVAVPKPQAPPCPPGVGPVDRALKAHRLAYFGPEDGQRPTPVYERSRLGAGDELTGPAIIEQMDSTTVVYPGQSAHVDRLGNIIIRTA
ncbi:MAG: hydantoinase/oxoprolinase family protein [Chloroflexi bacterium]|nr:hydantoinase/oxoprolinase family protein [Chloroflexota bacterium]